MRKMENQILSNKATGASSKLFSYFIRIFKYLLVIAIVYFVGRKIVSNWGEIKDYDWQINPFLLLLSILLHQIALLIYSKMWCMVIKSFGYNLPLKYGFRISNLANLGRYIPGKIWSALGAIYLLRPFGISKELAVTSWILTTIFILPPAFLLGFLAILSYPQTISHLAGFNIWSFIALAIMICISIFIIFFSKRTSELFNIFLKKIKRPAIDFAFGKKIAVQIFMGYLIGWIVYGIAFYTFLNSIMMDPGIPLLVGIGSFILAYVIGYLTIFSPGGLGVRELVLMAILSAYFGPLTAGVAGIARIWNIISEIVSALIALSIRAPENPTDKKA
jgi:uncharacterized membrane protein YbhN (UPF0104 family)